MKVQLALLTTFGLLSQTIGKDIINCYWGTWSNYRTGDGKFDVSNINPSLCTHISYSFFGIEDNGQFKSLDDWLDNGLGTVSKTIALKKINPNLKVLAVVGGWKEGSTKYSAMAADPAKRARFVSSSLNYIKANGFDGLDLDWEYPAQRGGSPADRANFVTLLKELKSALEPNSLKLGIAVGASEETAKTSYDVRGIAQNVDFINVMTYDFHPQGSLGFNAPLPEIKKSIDYWLQQGAPADKLILGIGSYGRSYQMANPAQTQPGASAISDGSPGPITAQNGYLGYNEICPNKWQTVFDAQNVVPYAFQGNQWVGFDNVKSVEQKMNFLKSKNLGGAMMWSLETDDFRGKCGESWPILKTINRALGKGGNGNNGNVPPPPPPGSAPTPSPTTGNPSNGGDHNSGTCSRDGFFLNRSDCTRYYQCNNGIKYDFQCNAGLYFDQNSSSCNWAELVNCSPK